VAALGRAGYRIREIPVCMRKREVGRSSITPLRSAYYAIKVTLALLIGQLRTPPERPEVPQERPNLPAEIQQPEFGAA
jgi:hypothetical protein